MKSHKYPRTTQQKTNDHQPHLKTPVKASTAPSAKPQRPLRSSLQLQPEARLQPSPDTPQTPHASHSQSPPPSHSSPPHSKYAASNSPHPAPPPPRPSQPPHEPPRPAEPAAPAPATPAVPPAPRSMPSCEVVLFQPCALP